MKTQFLAAAALAAAAATAAPAPASAQEFYIGQILVGGWSYCPRATTEANGQLLAISSNEALFSLYGTMYGGDGRTTFGLPELRGRIPMHFGHGPGLPNYPQGAKGGSPTTTQSVSQLAPHSHTGTGTPAAANAVGTTASPVGAVPAGQSGTNVYAAGSAANAAMSANSTALTINDAGGGQPMTTQSPYLAFRYCVVLQGIYPPRN